MSSTGSLDETLAPIRVEPALLDAIAAARGVELARSPGSRLKMAEWVRRLLWEALAARGFGPAVCQSAKRAA